MCERVVTFLIGVGLHRPCRERTLQVYVDQNKNQSCKIDTAESELTKELSDDDDVPLGIIQRRCFIYNSNASAPCRAVLHALPAIAVPLVPTPPTTSPRPQWALILVTGIFTLASVKVYGFSGPSNAIRSSPAPWVEDDSGLIPATQDCFVYFEKKTTRMCITGYFIAVVPGCFCGCKNGSTPIPEW